VELKAPPTVTVDEGVIWLTQEADAEWWRCARQAGGTLTVEYLVGDGAHREAKKTSKVSRAKLQIGAYRSFLCGSKGRHLQFRLVGTGPMERLSADTEVVPIGTDMCPRCKYRSYDTIFGLMFLDQIQANVQVNEEWFRCAKQGSAWELRFYPGGSRESVMAATEPAYVYDLMGKAKHGRALIPYAKVCQGRNWEYVGVEAVATGEMKPASIGRQAYKVSGRCRWGMVQVEKWVPAR